MSGHGNASGIIGPLSGESTAHLVDFSSPWRHGSVMQSFDGFFVVNLKKPFKNSWVVSDLIRHGALWRHSIVLSNYTKKKGFSYPSINIVMIREISYEKHFCQHRTGFCGRVCRHGIWASALCLFHHCGACHLQRVWYIYLSNFIDWYPILDGPLARYVKSRVAHAPVMPGTFSLPPTSKETAS